MQVNTGPSFDVVTRWRRGKKNTFSTQLNKVFRWSWCLFCFDIIANETVLPESRQPSGLLWFDFLNALLASSAWSHSWYTCLVSNMEELESTPPSHTHPHTHKHPFQLFPNQPPTLLFHHMLISCSWLKRGLSVSPHAPNEGPKAISSPSLSSPLLSSPSAVLSSGLTSTLVRSAVRLACRNVLSRPSLKKAHSRKVGRRSQWSQQSCSRCKKGRQE